MENTYKIIFSGVVITLLFIVAGLIPAVANAQSCTYHSSQRCVGSSLYWYDSCGVQQDLAQYCTSGCINNYCTNTNNYSAGTLTASKTVRNLTAGSGFSTSAYASPADMLMFMITLQATGQDVQNVLVRDTLPANLNFSDQLVVACTTNGTISTNCTNNIYNYTGNIASGINLSTIYAGQTVTITYQAKLANADNFAFGTTTLTNNVIVTSSSTGYTPSSNASIVVTKSSVLGASTVNTGLTDNFWVDSFLLPMIITLLGIWMFKSGMFFGVEKWIDNKRMIRRGYKAEREFTSRIDEIRRVEKI